MHTLFTLIAFIPAFIAGLGFIPFYWVGVSALAAYLDSILFVGERIGGDFRELNSDEFMQKEKIIKTSFFGSLVIIAIIYGIGRLIAWMFI